MFVGVGIVGNAEGIEYGPGGAPHGRLGDVEFPYLTTQVDEEGDGRSGWYAQAGPPR